MTPFKQKDFLNSLKELAAAYRTAIENAYDGFDDTPSVIAERQAKAQHPTTGFDFFVNTYFPHYVRSKSKSALHTYLFEMLPKVLHDNKGAKLAIAAPRGEAKSTLVSQLYTLYLSLIHI